MASLEELETPGVLVDLDIVERNLRAMATMCAQHGVRLRPHTKTHKSPFFAHWQVALGAQGITVAKLAEAEVMVNSGLRDILVAFPPVGPSKLNRLASLLERAEVIVSLDSSEVAGPLSALGRDLGRRLPVYVEVDTGLKRMGRPAGEPTAALVRELISLPGLEIRGLMTHAGHAYRAGSSDEVQAIGIQEGSSLVETRDLLRRERIDVPIVSVGSTPTARSAVTVPGVSEIRPGAYIFNDAVTVSTGVAAWEDCALTVIATVVGRPIRDRAIIDAGTKTLSSDGHPTPGQGMGHMLGHEDLTLDRLTEEHGIIRPRDDRASLPLRVGDRISIVPNHVCTVVNLADTVFLVRGRRVITELRVEGRGKRQ